MILGRDLIFGYLDPWSIASYAPGLQIVEVVFKKGTRAAPLQEYKDCKDSGLPLAVAQGPFENRNRQL